MGRAMLAGELRLGDQVLREIPASIFAGDRGAFARPGTGLNLGSGILRRYTVSFDYGKRRIYLEPNRHIDDAWPQDRTGLWLSQAEGALVVEAVAPESAAAAAGIVPGDRVVTIAGEAIRQRSLSDWRDWLGQQAVGTSFAIGIASANGTTERTLTLSERTAKPRRS
jgi:predicted metalloprotease with PDZ domain